MYGTSLSATTFSFNRAVDLRLCSARQYAGEARELLHAFEVYGAEKSFIVIAASDSAQRAWVDAINAAISALGPREAAAAPVAPLWVPDQGSDRCMICKAVCGRVLISFLTHSLTHST